VVDHLPADQDFVRARTDIASGRAMPTVLARDSSTILSRSDPGSGGAAAAQDALTDYTAKCDVYWKLNWIRKELLAGRVPIDLASLIDRTRHVIAATHPDGNYDLGMDALAHLEKGLDHLAAARTIAEGGHGGGSAPWHSGRTVMQRYVDDWLLGPSRFLKQLNPHAPGGMLDDPDADDADALPGHTRVVPDVPPAPAREAASLMVTYASRYDASPEEMMRREWKLAIEKTNRLRDNLYLMGKPQNADGNSTEISSVPVQTRAVGPAADETQAPGAAAAGKDNPILHEPADPFAP
jgi:hypothetical protein